MAETTGAIIMIALKGLVIKSGHAETKISLFNGGGVLRTFDRPDLKRGMSVEIDFDYTKLEIRNVWIAGTRPTFDEPVAEVEEVDDDTFVSFIDSCVPSMTMVDSFDKWCAEEEIPLPWEV